MSRKRKTPHKSENDSIKHPRIYADGVYDLFHIGHVLQLKQAKEMLPNAILVVGVCGDDLTHSHKGRTVLPESIRYESVRHCKYVDEVIENAPWNITIEFMKEHALDYVAHDDEPYAGVGSTDIYGWLKDAGMFLPTQRTGGISTSGIITMIIRQYDDYVQRNLARGISAKDMNVSFFKEKQIVVSNNLKKFGEKIKSVESKVKEVSEKVEAEVDEVKDNVMYNYDNLTINLQTWVASRTKLFEGFVHTFTGDLKKQILHLGDELGFISKKRKIEYPIP